MIDSFLSL